MIKINVFISDKTWKKNIRRPENYLKRKLAILKKNVFFKKKKLEFSILLSKSSEVKKLNKKFRKKNKTTDVLSFPFYNSKELKKKIKENRKVYIGDIIININKIKKNLKDKKIFIKNFDKLWIHGLLHLFGYDHKKNKEFKKMSKTETKLLSLISKNAE